jgi:hypothetical protein
MKLTRGKIFLIILLSTLLFGAIYGWHKYKVFMTAPTTRLTIGKYYPEMPQDEHHIYIRLPIDHENQSFGTFTDFYLLSPNFKPGGNVIFKLYDNQQEAVGMIGGPGDFEYFDEQIGKNLSYVLIGNRGVTPTLFPELFDKDGKPDYALALRLYGSEEQIEDIEDVRLDMVLIQQYLNKYGDHVSRALIESTGAMDIAKENNLTFSRSFYDTNPAAAENFYRLLQKEGRNSSLAWMLFKIGLEGNTQLQTDILNSKNSFFNISGKFLYIKNWLKIPQNLPLINLIFHAPSELEVKVRIWEVAGADLIKYKPGSAKEVTLLYETLGYFLSDFLDAYKAGKITAPEFKLDRSQYTGEVLIWANTDDQDFGPQIAKLINNAYPHSKLAIFNEKAHHLQKKSEYQLDFINAFFETGLYSAEITKYFADSRQVNK